MITHVQTATAAPMTHAEMDRIVEIHFNAEDTHDIEAVLETVTDDAVNDAIGFPGSPFRGKAAIREMYLGLFANVDFDSTTPNYRLYGENMVVDDVMVHGRVTGSFCGLPGNGRRVTFRLHHVFRFENGKIAYENVWLDGAAVAAQLA